MVYIHIYCIYSYTMVQRSRNFTSKNITIIYNCNNLTMALKTAENCLEMPHLEHTHSEVKKQVKYCNTRYTTIKNKSVILVLILFYKIVC